MGNNYTQYEIEELWKDFIENVNHMKDTLTEKNETEIKHYILYIMAYTKFQDKKVYKHMLKTIDAVYKTMKKGSLYEVDDEEDNNKINDININDDF